MRTKQIGVLIQVASVVASIMGATTFSVCAAEVSSPVKSDRSGDRSVAISPESISPESITWSSDSQVDRVESSTPQIPNIATDIATDIATTVEPIMQPSAVTNSIFSDTKAGISKPTDSVFQPWTDHTTSYATNNVEWQTSHRVVLGTPYSAEEHRTPESIQSTLDFSNETAIQLTPTTPLKLEQLTPESWQMAQAEAAPPDASNASETTPAPQSPSQSPPWQFTITPYGFVPLTVDGTVTVRDFKADFNTDLNDLLDILNFALAGRFEAWKGHLGFIFDGAYFNVGQQNSVSRSIPDCLCDIFPSKITTDVNVQFGQFDLGVGYRMAANSSHAVTDFELGPIAFDTIVGMRIYAIQQDIDLSTNLGTERNLSQSNTLVTPLASGRIRWNLSPTIAGWVRGDIAGFGLGGTLSAFSLTGGFDWMFSGNTSLLLAYRFSSLKYNTEIRGQDFGMDLSMQGPYLGVVFRF